MGRDRTEISLWVDARKPGNQSIRCSGELEALGGVAIRFLFPVWTPGSYLIREFSKNLMGLTFRLDGGEVPFAQVSKNEWMVAPEKGGRLRWEYELHCGELSVRTNYASDRLVLLNACATFLLPWEQEAPRFGLEVLVPEGWKVACPLPPREGAEGSYVAEDVDTLLDSPLLMGELEERRFEVDGVPHLLSFVGAEDSVMDRVSAALEKGVPVTREVFGGELPYPSYHGLFVFDKGGSGGLEHANSFVVHYPRDRCHSEKDLLRLLSLNAHEHFHAWNVKRIRPTGLERYDYFKENYTTGLWLSEGFTSYYQDKVLYRAGLMGRTEFLDALSQQWNRLLTIPGRKEQTLRQASFDAWIRLYRADENTVNSTVSYYLKGAIAAFALDVLIQKHSAGKHSLDDVMRGLWKDYLDQGPGQSEALVFELCSKFAGRDLGEELELLIGGTEDPPLLEWCEGLGLCYVQEKGKAGSGGGRPWFGFDAKENGGRLSIKQVRRGSPAWEAMLLPGDELVAIAGRRVEAPLEAFLQSLGLELGEPVLFEVARRGALHRVRVRPGVCPHPRGNFRDAGSPRFCAAQES
ncbi:MAG TPA: M61 family peptidase [Planctomycetes bacterium]|nr:M61 family peptidase [Planctomycetota bacterium]